MNKSDITEKQYDKIMREAKKVFDFQESIDNPYSFHKAFEFAKIEIKKHSEKRINHV